MPLDSTLTLTSALLAALSLLALAFAWYGRRTDDHPLCRHCRFDLFALPDTTIHCPECGRNIRQPRATRIGHRQARKPLLTASLLVLLLSGGTLALLVTARLRGIDTLRYQPTWMVRNAANSTDAALADRAYTELLRRIKAGAAHTADIAPLVDHTLEIQADATKPWRPSMGDFVEQAWLANAVDNDPWKRYLSQMLQSSLDLQFRDVVSRTGSFARSLTTHPPRGGSVKKRFTPSVLIQFDCDYPNGVALNSSQINPASMSYSTGYESAKRIVERLPSGAHTLRATFSAAVSAVDDPQSRTVDVQFAIDRPWTLTDGPSAVPFDDPARADEIRRCVKIEFSTRYGRLGPMPVITVKSPPCPVAWDVQIATPGATKDDDGFSRPTPHVTCVPGQTATANMFFSSVRLPPDAQTVTITLTPSRTAAEQSIALKSYWNGSLVFKDMPVRGLETNKRR
jgi:hypothetical protein